MRERLGAWGNAGVTTLNLTPIAPTHEARVALIEQIRAMAEEGDPAPWPGARPMAEMHAAVGAT